MPCNCNHSQNLGTAQQRSVCRTNPCNTAQNICELRNTCPSRQTDCSPIYPERTLAEVMEERNYQRCTDKNHCTAFYPADCRDSFWPSFAHPRWLCCCELYCNK